MVRYIHSNIFCPPLLLGKWWSKLTVAHVFQMGWFNHQLVNILLVTAMQSLGWWPSWDSNPRWCCRCSGPGAFERRLSSGSHGRSIRKIRWRKDGEDPLEDGIWWHVCNFFGSTARLGNRWSPAFFFKVINLQGWKYAYAKYVLRGQPIWEV